MLKKSSLPQSSPEMMAFFKVACLFNRQPRAWSDHCAGVKNLVARRFLQQDKHVSYPVLNSLGFILRQKDEI